MLCARYPVWSYRLEFTPTQHQGRLEHTSRPLRWLWTLAQEATRDVKPATEGTELVLFDPACGSGELLKECLHLLGLQGYPGRIRVIGWDKSASAVDMARFVLSLEKCTWRNDQVTTVEIVLQDSFSCTYGPPTLTFSLN